MTSEPTIYVVDDKESNRELLEGLMMSVGLSVEAYASAQDFLDTLDPTRPGCLLLDVRMPGMSGLELQKVLRARAIKLPVIIVTAHGDTEVAVEAMKAGAFDFVEKPINNQKVLDLVHQALALGARMVEEETRLNEIRGRFERLTPRERDVLAEIVKGEPNKRVAYTLDVSIKTVEFHRARVMEKMEARSLADLIRMTLALDGETGGTSGSTQRL